MKKYFIIFISLAIVLGTMLLPVQLNVKANVNPHIDPIGEMGKAKKNGQAFKIKVLSNNVTFGEKLKNSNFPVDFDLLPSSQMNSLTNADALFLGEDLIRDATNPNHEIYQNVKNILKEKKQVVFVGEKNSEKLSKAFDLPIHSVPTNEKTYMQGEEDPNQERRKYMTVATWLQETAEGTTTIGEVVVPEDHKDHTKEILETLWVYKDGVDKVRNRTNVETQIVKPNVSEATETLTASSNWTSRGDYIYYVYDNPYGKVNQMYRYYQATPDGNSTYDWFVYEWKTELVPGYVLAASDSNFSTAYRINNYYTRTFTNISSGQIMYEYGPRNTYSMSSSTASVNLGLTAGNLGASVNAGFSYTWDIPDLYVENWGDSSVQKENHKFGFNSAGKHTSFVIPGVNTRVYQGQNAAAKYYRSIHWWDIKGMDIQGYYTEGYFYIDNFNS